jgi:hypothetical protein
MNRRPAYGFTNVLINNRFPSKISRDTGPVETLANAKTGEVLFSLYTNHYRLGWNHLYRNRNMADTDRGASKSRHLKTLGARFVDDSDLLATDSDDGTLPGNPAPRSSSFASFVAASIAFRTADIMIRPVLCRVSFVRCWAAVKGNFRVIGRFFILSMAQA